MSEKLSEQKSLKRSVTTLIKNSSTTACLVRPPASLMSSGNRATEAHIEDYSDTLVKLLDLNKNQNGVVTASDRSYLENLSGAWRSLYHADIGPNFKYMDAELKKYESSASKSTTSRLNKSKLVKPSSPSSKEGPNKTSKTVNGLKRENSGQNLTDAPGVYVRFKEYSKPKAADRRESVKFWQQIDKNADNIRLAPALIEQLNLNQLYADEARDFYFHPKTLTFTPIMIVEPKQASLKK